MAISLEKGKKVNLRKQEKAGLGEILVNLNWNSKPAKKGLLGSLFGGGSKPIDLDLGCLYELKNGKKGTVQALGNAFGSFQQAPYISLDGDDRSGANTGGENMHVNLGDPSAFRRILIFAMIYDGAPNWAAVDGVVTLYPTNGPEVEVRLDSASNQERLCAIALIQSSGQGVTVTREVQYINGSQSDLDRAYNWGMKWAAGRK